MTGCTVSRERQLLCSVTAVVWWSTVAKMTSSVTTSEGRPGWSQHSGVGRYTLSLRVKSLIGFSLALALALHTTLLILLIFRES